jgi:hypothetical protein
MEEVLVVVVLADTEQHCQRVLVDHHHLQNQN